ncbi:MAG: hypothetical protein ABFD00_07945 [Chloroherpetonaceae bacterium]
MKKTVISNWNAKIVLIALFAAFSAFVISCEKDEIVTVQPPPSGCDTINITFQTTIQPIIVQKCQSCHSNSTQLGGENLEGYDNIKSSALSGRLLDALEGSMQGYLNDACEFLKIRAWINKGAPND